MDKMMPRTTINAFRPIYTSSEKFPYLDNDQKR